MVSSPFKGKTQTPEARAKMSATRIGKYTKENSPHWKGGRGTERHRLMGSSEYKSWRDEIFRRDNYTCRFCDQYGVALHADHIKPWAKYPELRFDASNGRTLCVPCHYYITFKRKMPVGAIWCNYRMTRKIG